MLLPSHGVVDFRSRPRKHGMELDLVGCERCFFFKKMHKDTVRKKKNMHRLTAPKKDTCKGMMPIYIIYANIGKTGFVERSRKL